MSPLENTLPEEDIALSSLEGTMPSTAMMKAHTSIITRMDAEITSLRSQVQLLADDNHLLRIENKDLKVQLDTPDDGEYPV